MHKKGSWDVEKVLTAFSSQKKVRQDFSTFYEDFIGLLFQPLQMA
jgi:hypothetical protein